MIIYGISTCDTVRRARKALTDAGLKPKFRNVRSDPMSREELEEFHRVFGDAIVNRASATWRETSQAERELPVVDLLALHPTLMKRPVIREGDVLTLGWTAEVQKRWLG